MAKAKADKYQERIVKINADNVLSLYDKKMDIFRQLARYRKQGNKLTNKAAVKKAMFGFVLDVVTYVNKHEKDLGKISSTTWNAMVNQQADELWNDYGLKNIKKSTAKNKKKSWWE